MYGACGEAGDPGPDLGRRLALPAPPPALCPLTQPVWRSPCGASSPPRAGRRAGGRVWACKPVCLDPPHKQARLAPSTRVQPTRDTPWLPLLSSPLLAWRFRGDSVGPRNWVSSVCSGLDLNTGPSPRRTLGSPPRAEAWGGIPVQSRGSPHHGWVGEGDCRVVRGLLWEGPVWGRGSHLLPGLLLASLCHLAHLLLSEGSVPPTPFLPQRALPGLHFWDNSTLLLLAPCQHPPALWSGAGRQLVRARCAAPWGEQKGDSWAAWVPFSSHGHTPTASPGPLVGRAGVPGCLPRDGGHLPPPPPPRWPGQPRRVFLDRVEGVGWRGQAGREGQWAWFCHGRGIWRMWPFCGGCGVGGQGPGVGGKGCAPRMLTYTAPCVPSTTPRFTGPSPRTLASLWVPRGSGVQSRAPPSKAAGLSPLSQGGTDTGNQ